MERVWYLRDAEGVRRVLERNEALAVARGAVPCKPRVRRVKASDRWCSSIARQRAPWGIAFWCYPDDPEHVVEMLFRDFESVQRCLRELDRKLAVH